MTQTCNTLVLIYTWLEWIYILHIIYRKIIKIPYKTKFRRCQSCFNQLLSFPKLVTILRLRNNYTECIIDKLVEWREVRKGNYVSPYMRLLHHHLSSESYSQTKKYYYTSIRHYFFYINPETLMKYEKYTLLFPIHIYH